VDTRGVADRSNNVFGNVFYLNQGHGAFVEISDKIGAETYWPWASVVADLKRTVTRTCS